MTSLRKITWQAQRSRARLGFDAPRQSADWTAASAIEVESHTGAYQVQGAGQGSTDSSKDITQGNHDVSAARSSP